MGLEYRALRRDPAFRPIVIDRPGVGEREKDKTPHVRCPLCGWRPRPTSRWFCAPCPVPEGLLRGCGTLWHTFETRGQCPGCLHQWRWTCCLACAGWSPHDDWYVEE